MGSVLAPMREILQENESDPGWTRKNTGVDSFWEGELAPMAPMAPDGRNTTARSRSSCNSIAIDRWLLEILVMDTSSTALQPQWVQRAKSLGKMKVNKGGHVKTQGWTRKGLTRGGGGHAKTQGWARKRLTRGGERVCFNV